MLDALHHSDLTDAAKLLAGEGWTFTPKELARLLATAPGLSVAAREGGEVQGLLTVARHGALAWIGNVAVRPELRGQGLGHALLEDALRRIDAAGVRTTKLCSVPKAIPLYQRLGFVGEGVTRTFSMVQERPTHRPVEAEVLLPDALPEVRALDAQAFGADRGALLAMLAPDYADTGVLLRGAQGLDGFAFLKAGSEGSEIGPMVVARPDARLAAALLDACLGFRLQGSAAAVECSASALSPFMEALLRERGFRPRASSVLMRRGLPVEQDWVRCAALGGLEKG
jgi:GNAT superfamily N-acetyltransferase